MHNYNKDVNFFLQGYLFRVLDTISILLIDFFPYHIPDKCVGMFSSLDHLKKAPSCHFEMRLMTKLTEYILDGDIPAAVKAHTHVITTIRKKS